MKRSIRKQVTLIFTIILLSTIGLCILLNLFFLKSYYIANKKHTLMQAYNALDDASVTRNIGGAQSALKIREVCELGDISYIVLDDEDNIILSGQSFSDDFIEHMNELFYVDKDKEIKLFLDANTYVIKSYKDENLNREYLEMWGVLYYGEKFLLRIAIESVDYNVSVTVKFLIYVGLLSTLVGTVFIVFYTEKFTQPILKLSQISSRMKNLDFNAKYDSKGNNEFDLLGENINDLSDILEKNISELKTANVRLRNDIRKKEEIEIMRKEFISNVSHEFKTPIALIQSYAEGIKEGISDDEESRNYYLDVIIDESNRMNRLVKELMSLSELEFGNNDVEFERFDICELIKNKIDSMEVLLKQNNIDLIFTKNNEKIYVWSDEFRVEEVLQNYMSNAIHYCTKEKMIVIDIEEMKNSVRITVFNTGYNIEEEQLDKLWDKFYKVDKARSRDYGGSGIGLSIVKAIMESIDMDYGVFNSHNGVTFYFDLPTK